MTEQIIKELQIGYLFKDEKNNIVSVKHIHLINSIDTMCSIQSAIRYNFK